MLQYSKQQAVDSSGAVDLGDKSDIISRAKKSLISTPDPTVDIFSDYEGKSLMRLEYRAKASNYYQPSSSDSEHAVSKAKPKPHQYAVPQLNNKPNISSLAASLFKLQCSDGQKVLAVNK